MAKNKYVFLGAILVVGMMLISSLVSISALKQNVLSQPVDINVEVATDKTEYEVGETVAIITKNVGNDTVIITGPCFYIYNEWDELVFEACLFALWELDPGEYETFIWDQTGSNGNQVPGGKYVVVGEFTINDEKYSDYAVFNISKNSRFCGFVYGSDGETPLNQATIFIDDVDCVWYTDENGYYETEYFWVEGWWDLIASPPEGYQEIYLSSYKIAKVENSESCRVDFILEDFKPNNSPENVMIEGSVSCKVGDEYEYTYRAEDPENNQIYFSVYWGDEQRPSFYTADPDGTFKVSRIWEEKGEYSISAYAIDEYGFQSNIVTLDVIASKNKELSKKPFISYLSQRFPLISQLLKKLL